MRATTRNLRAFGRFLAWLGRRREGAISIELAFVILGLLTLAVGVVDIGGVMMEKNRLVGAAGAGAQYATQDASTANDAVGIEAAVRLSAADTEGALDVSARNYCGCPGAGEVVCSATCTDGAPAPRYVEVAVTTTRDFLFTYPGLGGSTEVEGRSTLRLR